MIKLIAVILLILIIPTLLLFAVVELIKGLGSETDGGDYRDEFNKMNSIAANDCKGRGMKYVTVSEPYEDVYNTYCYTESPFKIYTFEVKN